MKHFITIGLISAMSLISQNKFQSVSFFHQFDNDSVDIYVNDKKIESKVLKTDPSLGTCSYGFDVYFADKDKVLRI